MSPDHPSPAVRGWLDAFGRRSLAGTVVLVLSSCGSDTVGPGGEQNDDAMDSDPVVAAIEVAPDTDTLTHLGASLTLEPTAVDAEGAVVTGVSYDWSSSAPDVATVDADGMVSAVSDGVAEITASTGAVDGLATVVVSQVATHLAFGSPPRHSLAGASIGDGIDVEILDAGGNVVPSAAGTITVELVEPPNGVVLVGQTTAATVFGEATFDLVIEEVSDDLVLRASSGELDPVDSEPFHIWDHPVHVDSLVLARDTLAIGGGAVGYTVWLTNIGPTVETAGVQGYVEQSGVRHAGGGRVVGCDGAVLGELPAGSCSVSFTLGARDDGSLVPGPADAIFEIFGDGSTSFSHEVSQPVTLVEFVPPVPPDVHFGTVTFEGTELTIDGAAVVYHAFIENDEGETVPDVVVQGTVEQGSVVRAAGGAAVLCTSEPGDVPPGGCLHSFTAAARNGAGGTGTLVPGAAIVRLQLHTYIDGVYVDLGDVTVDVTLVG